MIAVFLFLLLPGCAAVQDTAGLGPTETHDYLCRDESEVTVVYAAHGGWARVSTKGATAHMVRMDAPFGDRFIAGDGTTFWVNGRDIMMEWQSGAMLFCREGG